MRWIFFSFSIFSSYCWAVAEGGGEYDPLTFSVAFVPGVRTFLLFLYES